MIQIPLGETVVILCEPMEFPSNDEVLGAIGLSTVLGYAVPGLIRMIFRKNDIRSVYGDDPREIDRVDMSAYAVSAILAVASIYLGDKVFDEQPIASIMMRNGGFFALVRNIVIGVDVIRKMK